MSTQHEKPSTAQKRNSSEWFASFDRPDASVVTDVAIHFNTMPNPVEEIVIQSCEPESKDAIVWAKVVTKKGPVLRQINWDNPALTPDDYIEYAYNFYDFRGPIQRQEQRAALLAEVFHIPVARIEEIPRGALRIPSLGLVLLNNPLKDNPYYPCR